MIIDSHKRWVYFIVGNQDRLTDDEIAEHLHTTKASIRKIRKMYPECFTSEFIASAKRLAGL